jgi:hypothetical protein
MGVGFSLWGWGKNTFEAGNEKYFMVGNEKYHSFNHRSIDIYCACVICGVNFFQRVIGTKSLLLLLLVTKHRL